MLVCCDATPVLSGQQHEIARQHFRPLWNRILPLTFPLGQLRLALAISACRRRSRRPQLRTQECNSKLLALCGAGMLSSVATLIHDTYLPLYLQDVLGMSNQKVGAPPPSSPLCPPRAAARCRAPGLPRGRPRRQVT